MESTGSLSTALTRSEMASSSDGGRLSGPTERRAKHSAAPPSHRLRNSTRPCDGAATSALAAGHSGTGCELASRARGALSAPASIFASTATSPPLSKLQSGPTPCRAVHDAAATAKTTTVPKAGPVYRLHAPLGTDRTTASHASLGPLTKVPRCNESIHAVGQSYSGCATPNDT